MLNHSLAIAISGYQKYLSPYKGFCCAHKVHHGGVSCSEFVKQALLQDGLWQATPDIRQRFRECKTAALALSANQPPRQNRSRRQPADRHKSRAADACDCLSGIGELPCGSCHLLEFEAAEACACISW